MKHIKPLEIEIHGRKRNNVTANIYSYDQKAFQRKKEMPDVFFSTTTFHYSSTIIPAPAVSPPVLNESSL